MLNKDKILLESLITKYGIGSVNNAINKLNENSNMGIKLSNILKNGVRKKF